MFYRKNRKRLERLVNDRNDAMSKEIKRFFQDHPKLFRVLSMKENDYEYFQPINTNLVEGLFSQSRIMLDGLRNTPDTPYIRSRLILFRYWHNFVGPLSGPNAENPPSSRIGIKLAKYTPIQQICSSINSFKSCY